MYKAGTRIYADCGSYQVQGALLDDYEELDAQLRIWDEDENEETVINGWLWCIDLIDDDDQPI